MCKATAENALRQQFIHKLSSNFEGLETTMVSITLAIGVRKTTVLHITFIGVSEKTAQ